MSIAGRYVPPVFLAKACVPLLACLLVAGCNNADPYGDQTIGGNVLEPSTVNPLDQNETAATEVALFLNKPVQGLAYSCQDGQNHRSHMTYNSQTQDDGNAVVTTVVPVARCGNDASSITFYLGAKELLGEQHSVDLGRVYLPMTMPLGADGLARNYVDNISGKAAISTSTFMFNFSLLDMPASPERLSLAGAFDATGHCNSGKQKVCKAVYVAALLMALDENNGTGDKISIDPNADVKMAASATYAALSFNQTSYADFRADWTNFVADVRGSNTLPTDSTAVLAAIQNNLAAGASRLRAGNYQLDYNSQVVGYKLYYPSSSLMIQMGLGSLAMQYLVYPDGRMAGFGKAVANLGSLCPSANTANGAVNCLLFNLDTKNFLSVYGVNSSQAKLTDTLQLDSVALTSIDNDSDGVAIRLFGRFFGNYIYDGRQPQTAGEKTDFLLDYPSASYAPTDAEKGSMTGQFFSITLPDYLDDGQGGQMVGTKVQGEYTDPWPLPMRLDKTASIQTTPFNETSLSLLRDQFYRIQLMRLCDGAHACDKTFNGHTSVEVGDTSNFNYPTQLCIRAEDNGVDCKTSIKSLDVGEMPRPNQLGGTDTNVNLKFVDGSAPGSMVAELLNDSCQPVTDALGNNLLVGYVNGTPSDTSVDITLLFASPDITSQSKVPQLGVALAGRIDLSDPANAQIYRMGDSNFTSRLRARWLDSNRYRANDYVRTLGATKLDDLDDAKRQMVLGMATGAVQGQLLKADGSCVPQ